MRAELSLAPGGAEYFAGLGFATSQGQALLLGLQRQRCMEENLSGHTLVAQHPREWGGYPPEARQPRSPQTQQVSEKLQALRGTGLTGGVSPSIPHRLKAQPPRKEVQGHRSSTGTGQRAPCPGAPAHLLGTRLLRRRLAGHTLARGHFLRPPHRAGLGGLWVWFSRGWSE